MSSRIVDAVAALSPAGAADRPNPPLGRIQDAYGLRCLPARLVLALDHFRLALTQVARLSTPRLAGLNEPAHTRLRAASPGHAVLSRGVEEQAGFASLAARQTLRAGAAYRLVVGCELLAAGRALRRRDLRPDPGLPAGRACALAESVLDADPAGRPLTDDVTQAAALLDRFTDIWRGSAS